MAEQPLNFPSQSPQGIDALEPQDVELPSDDPQDQIVSLDGSPVEDEQPPPDQEFDGNLAEHLKDDELATLANDLLVAVDEDKRGRSEWESIYKDGLKYLGIKEEKKATPWQGACGTTHPMILEAVVRYGSRALVKLFPSDGPCKLEVDIDHEQASQQIQIETAKAQRRLNRYLRESMPELRDETDRLLFSQAEIGWAAKKVYWHPKLNRVTTQFVPAEHFLIPYGNPNLEICPRFTEIVRRSDDEIKSLQRTGFYRDVVISAPVENMDEIDLAKAKQSGQEPSPILEDGVKLYEVHADLYIEGDQFADQDGENSPYIVTIEESSSQILSIRRAWRQTDHIRKKRGVFVAFPFVPGDGSYAYGYIHLIGQIASSATKIMRQLVDAGSLSNLPGGFKTKYARIASQEPIAPAEWRDVQASAEDLSKSFLPLPYKEPSQTLFALMQGIIEEGKSFSSTADLDISASSQNAPVGTTLALLERQTEVSNAIQSRLHDSFRRELGLIIELLKEYQPEEYQQIFGSLEAALGRSPLVYPVGDPTSATLSQRIIQLQSVLQLSAQAPQVFNLPALFRTALTAMGVEDVENLVPDSTQQEPMDPVQETMAILTGKPVKAFEYQDHDAHLSVHSSVAQDPYFQQKLAQNPQAMAIMGANEAHIAEHLAFQFRSQVQKQLGVQLPPLGQLPPQVESVVSSLVAPAVQRVIQQHAAQAQQQVAQQQAQDPAFQLEQQELQLKTQSEAHKNAIAQQKLQLEASRGQSKDQIEIMRIQSQERQAQQANASKLMADRASQQSDHIGTVVDIGKSLLDHKQKTDQAAMQNATQRAQSLLQHRANMASSLLQHKAQMASTDAQVEAAQNQENNTGE